MLVWVCLSIGLAGAASATTPIPRAVQSESIGAAAQKQIRAILKEPGSQPAKEVARLGPTIVDPLIALVDSGAWPRDPDSPKRADRLTEAEMALIYQALAELHDPHVRIQLRTALNPETPAARRITALRILAEIGTADDLALVMELGTQPNRRLERATHFWLAQAITGVLQRDADGYRTLGKLWGRGITAWQAEVARDALAGLPVPASLELLLRRLGAESEPNPAALTSIDRLAAQLAWIPEGLPLHPLRRLLSHHEAPIRARAARCLGSLDDVASIETLLARLHDADEEVRDYALAALRKLSGRGFGNEPSRWEDWYQDELTWWRGDGLQALQKLKSSQPGPVIAAALELCQHRLFAPEIIPELLPRIQNARLEVQTALYQALAQLGHRGAVPGLIELLQDSSDAQAAAVLPVLRTLTGRAEAEILDWALNP